MTDRAVADERQAIVREIDRMREKLANRACLGTAVLDKLRLWVLTREERETDREKMG